MGDQAGRRLGRIGGLLEHLLSTDSGQNVLFTYEIKKNDLKHRSSGRYGPFFVLFLAFFPFPTALD